MHITFPVTLAEERILFFPELVNVGILYTKNQDNDERWLPKGMCKALGLST